MLPSDFRQKSEICTKLGACLNPHAHNGRLPDDDADLFPKAIKKQLFIDTGPGGQTYQGLLSKNRDQRVAGLNGAAKQHKPQVT